MNTRGTCDKLQETFCEHVSEKCFKSLNGLGKSGIPANGEWTVLSAIVKEGTARDLEVVAMGTGSKCVGAAELPKLGDRLHDSHAEVITRRAFKLYLLEQLKHSLEGRESIFQYDKGKSFTLRPRISFHFYCSNIPCGDASIFPKEIGEAEYHSEGNTVAETAISGRRSSEGEGPPNKKRTREKEPRVSPEEWRSPVEVAGRKAELFTPVEDLHRTGAKCLRNETPDPREAGLNYHITGALRTKPGRGDPTLSLSCSDKMFKWTVLGVQGALPMLFINEPIYLQSIIIGSCLFNRHALERALYLRFKQKLSTVQFTAPFSVQTPHIMNSKASFPHAKPVLPLQDSSVSGGRPSAASIIWSRTETHRSKAEVSVDGKRLGTTNKNVDSYKSRVSICRMELLRRTFDLLRCIRDRDEAVYLSRFAGFSGAENLVMCYGDVKALSAPYQNMRHILQKSVLINWTDKPANLKYFSLDEPNEKKRNH